MVAGFQYVIVWEYRVKAAGEAEFVARYGPQGDWARFFRGSAAYVRTELVKDVAAAGRYLTLDYWQSQEAFKKFLKENPAEYERLDKEAEGLTEQETRLGAFWMGTES